MNKDEGFDYLFKIILIGDAGVGKTCIVQRFKTGSWFESQASTIGVDFCLKTCELDGKQVKLQVWDTAGQERFRTITQAYYRSADGVICAFDLTRPNTFDNVGQWMEDVSRYCSNNVVSLLVGNKCDMTSERRVTREAAMAQAASFGVLEYLETSAKENTNIEDSFLKMAEKLMQRGNTKMVDDTITSGMMNRKTKAVNSSCCFG